MRPHELGRNHSSNRNWLARASAAAGGMVIALGGIQICDAARSQPVSKTAGGRSSGWPVSLPRPAGLVDSGSPPALAGDRAARTAGYFAALYSAAHAEI